MKKVVRTDWNTNPMPVECEAVTVRREYSVEKFAKLEAGYLPPSMDDKWFIYYEEPWLVLHRSWTGNCIFRVRFERSATGFKVAEAIVNRNPEQCTPQGGDVALLEGLLESFASFDDPR